MVAAPPTSGLRHDQHRQCQAKAEVAAYPWLIPDNEDYRWLADHLRHPASWTEKDYDVMRHHARNQRESLTTMHPLDRKGRDSAERAAEEIEAAIAAYESLRTD